MKYRSHMLRLALALLLVPVLALPALAGEDTPEPEPLTCRGPIRATTRGNAGGESQGWSWDRKSSTLTLEAGLTVEAAGTCFDLPSGSTIVAKGNLTLLSGAALEEPDPAPETEPIETAQPETEPVETEPAETEPAETEQPEAEDGAESGQEEAPALHPAKNTTAPPAVNLGEKGKLVLAEGSTLTIRAKGDGIWGGDLSLNNCNLDIRAGGNGFSVKNLTLGEGVVAGLSCDGAGVHTAGSGDFVLAGAVSIDAGEAGVATTSEPAVKDKLDPSDLVRDPWNLWNRPSVSKKGSGQVRLEPGAYLSVRCGNPEAVGIDAKGGVSSEGTIDVVSGGAGVRTGWQSPLTANGALTVSAAGAALSAGGDVTLSGPADLRGAEGGVRAGGDLIVDGSAAGETPMTLAVSPCAGPAIQARGDVLIRSAAVTVEDAGGDGVRAGKDLRLEDGALTVSKTAGNGVSAGWDGLLHGGDVSLTGSQLVVGEAAGHGVAAEKALTLDAGSALTVAEAGESGVTAAELLTVDGTLTVGKAAGNGLVSTGAGLRLSGDLEIAALGDGVRCALGITCADTGTLTVEAGGDGVVSREGSVTLALRAGEEGKITAGGLGVRAGDGAVLCQPGFLTIEAGEIGVMAQGDVTVGGAEGARCDLAVTCETYSIWSQAGNVSLLSCDDCYYFDGGVRVDGKAGKTLSVMEGAGLVYGLRRGFGVGIFRKDYTITPDMTPELLSLRTLQIGADHTVTAAPGSQVKVGPLILGRNARFLCEGNSKVYYNGPTTQVLGQVQQYATAPMRFASGVPSRPDGQAAWDGKALTLKDALLDVPEGPAVTLPAGSVLRLEGTAALTSGGSTGPVISCAGSLTVEGGELVLSGGGSGIEAAGNLTLSGTKVSVRGAAQAALSAQAVYASHSALDVYGDGVAVRSAGVIAVDSLPRDVKAVQRDGWYVLERDGEALTRLALSGEGPAPSQVVVGTRDDPDGARVETATDQVTGVVTETTAAPTGAVTVRQTRPDGVTSTLSADPEGTATLQITLPEGMEGAVVDLPLSGAAGGTGPDQSGETGTPGETGAPGETGTPFGAGETLVPAQVLPDGSVRPIPLSDYRDGRLTLRVEGDAELVLVDKGQAFTDVPEGAWFAEPVHFAARRELFRGVGGGRFDPDGTTTCGMMATVLHRLCGEPETALPIGHPLFREISSDDYYAEAVAWALEQEVVDGEGDGFLPEAYVTRQQLAVFLFRCAGQLGLDTESRAALSPFDDSGEAGEWALPSLRWAVSQGILKGRGDGTLDPTGTATRAEVSAMLQRYIRRILEQGGA